MGGLDLELCAPPLHEHEAGCWNLSGMDEDTGSNFTQPTISPSPQCVIYLTKPVFRHLQQLNMSASLPPDSDSQTLLLHTLGYAIYSLPLINHHRS